jgi:hypothetical protein
VQIIVNGAYWQNGQRLDERVGIMFLGDEVEITLQREAEDDPPVFLSVEILEWAIKTLRAAPCEVADLDKSVG